MIGVRSEGLIGLAREVSWSKGEEGAIETMSTYPTSDPATLPNTNDLHIRNFGTNSYEILASLEYRSLSHILDINKYWRQCLYQYQNNRVLKIEIMAELGRSLLSEETNREMAKMLELMGQHWIGWKTEKQISWGQKYLTWLTLVSNANIPDEDDSYTRV